MILKVIGWTSIFTNLFKEVIDEFNLNNEIDLIAVEEISETYKEMVTEQPAICIEEPTIDFYDVIMQGEEISREEIKDLVLSLSSLNWNTSCDSNCSSCSSGC